MNIHSTQPHMTHHGSLYNYNQAMFASQTHRWNFFRQTEVMEPNR